MKQSLKIFFFILTLFAQPIFSQTSDSNKILTVTYCIALESNDTTEYRGYYRSTFENELRNALLAMGNLHVISPEPAGIFDSAALRFMKVIENDSTQRKVSNSKQFLSQYSKYANLDGVVFVSSTKIPIISPAHTGPRAVFILRSFLINFENDSIYFFKRRLAIGNEWTILNSDLAKLFLDTIRSDYHESPRSEMEKRSVNVFADGSPGPSLTCVPDIFDSVFSKAMNNQDSNSITKYYNENMSYNVYSVDECPEFSKGCDSCRSFYILNYFPLDRKPNQLYNKINFLKSACLLEYFFSRDTLNAISYPSNLHKTTFLAGITDFNHGDSLTKKYNITYERPFYLWAINLSEPKNGLQRQSVDSWVDESLNLPSFYSDIYKLSNQKPSTKKHLWFWLSVIVFIIAGITGVIIVIKIKTGLKNVFMEKRNKENKYVLHIDEKEYDIFIERNEKKWDYFMNLVNSRNRKTGVQPGEIEFGHGGKNASDSGQTFIDGKAQRNILMQIEKTKKELEKETDLEIRVAFEDEIEELERELSNTTFKGKKKRMSDAFKNQIEKINAAFERIRTKTKGKLPENIIELISRNIRYESGLFYFDY